MIAIYYTHQGELFLIVPFVILVVWAILDRRATKPPKKEKPTDWEDFWDAP